MSKIFVERIALWIAFILPKSVVTFAFARVWAFSSTGKYAGVEYDKLTYAQVMNEWLENGR